jgi:hypothetical protein
MDRNGTALLSLTTNRPPDSKRGTGLVHVAVTLPENISNQIELAEGGSRPPVEPKEAANLLWNTPVAAYLNGRSNAWLNVPGVRLLLPGLEALSRLDPAQWPPDQAGLKVFLAAAAPGGPTVEAWSDELKRAGTTGLLNDLLLVFKYAALHRSRPLDIVAGLYRLVIAATTQTDAPARREQMVAWLTASFLIPRVFVARPTLAPAKAPGPSGGGPRDGRPGPRFPTISFETEGGREILRRLEDEIAKLESGACTSALAEALRAEGIRDSAVVARLTRVLDGGAAGPRPTHAAAGDMPTDEPSAGIERSWRPPHRAEITRTYIGGYPVLVDLSAFERRTTLYRKALADHLMAALPASLRDRLARLGTSIDMLPVWPDVMTNAAQSPSYLEPVGRSDLLVVRQTTTGYRQSEIAYLENILVGETRFRQHTLRVTTRREEFEQTIKEEEETHDLQVSDRAELSREISAVLKEDLRAEGSIQVTSRGPTKVVASASASYNRSTEEAAKIAEEYSRETVERAVKRTMERVTREVRSIIEQEVIELNRHRFQRESTAPDHASGIYQYLERVSRAKIFCYGERELYDVLIPEPAALIWHMAVSRVEMHNPLQRPDAELFESLTLANIADKREEVIRAYQVSDLPDFPEEHKQVSMAISNTGSGDSAKHAQNKDLQIPDGYVAVDGSFVLSAEVEDSNSRPNGGWIAGNLVDTWIINNLTDNKGKAAEDFTFVTPQPGPSIAVAFHADNFTSIGGAISLNLELTEKARRDWAIEAYARVSARYEQLRLEYEQTIIQLASTQQAESTKLPEGSRLELQRMVRFELQRSVIDIMRNAPVDFALMGQYDFAQADGSLGRHPTADTDAVRASEPEIRFLQQAFEWEHMAWVLYPYFWGRRGQWDRTVVQTHPDPDFAAFLNAGAARVQISVRPGFEHAVKHYMETGEVYGGLGLPKMGDPAYVSFIDEQMTSLAAPGEEIAWPPDAPKEWTVLAPTPLVLARSVTKPQLPTWDPQTGEEV